MLSKYLPVILAVALVPFASAQITVYSAGSVAIGDSRGLTAYVPLSPSTVTWTVNGIAGGNSSVGTITSTGTYNATYQAPTSVPSTNAVNVRATSTAYPSKYGEITITITQLVPQLWSISPTSGPVGPFTISLNGSNYGANSVVNFGGVTLSVKLISATSIKASGTATAAQVGTKIPVSVTNTGTGSVTTASVNFTVTAAPPISVVVSPATASVTATSTQQFTAKVTGSSNTSVTWSANAGTISTTGVYTAPSTVPNPATVTVTAASVANPGSTSSATVTIQPKPVTVTLSPATASVATQASLQFSAAASDASSLNWSVNGTPGGSPTLGTISSTGLYIAPSVLPNPALVTVQAASTTSPNPSASASVLITTTANITAARFLEQAAFGPNATDLAHLQQIGIGAWLNEQISMPESPIPMPSGNDNGLMQQQYLNRLSAAPDQLRQRLLHAFTQIVPISMNKNNYADEMVPYLQILSHDSLANYRRLIGDISVSSQMGKYLDLANSVKPAPGTGANENYARELMQLFTIGVNRLNPDGSLVLDGQGNPLPNYTQADVQQVALALTGWVYINNAWEDFTGPMQPNEANHDKRQKVFLNCTLPANQTTTQDMNGVLDCLFNHPNIAPFIATRLIRALVTSNPSPAYIQRVSTAFNDNGFGVRGDLSAVVKAILTDAEARNDTAAPTFGKLKDPIFHIVSFTRALNGTINNPNGLSWEFGLSGQAPLMPASVFSFYSPLYHIPRSPLFGPEFQIYSPTEAVERGNFMWRIITNPGSDFTLNLSPFSAVAANTQQLINTVDQALLYGRMPSAMRQTLATAIDAQPDAASRMQTALYLTALSGQYTVQY